MTETVAQQVRRLAEAHGAAIDRDDPAIRMAVAFSRLEGIEGDETLMMIGELGRRGVISKDEGYDLAVRHYYECEMTHGAERDAKPREQALRHGVGSP